MHVYWKGICDLREYLEDYFRNIMPDEKAGRHTTQHWDKAAGHLHSARNEPKQRLLYVSGWLRPPEVYASNVDSQIDITGRSLPYLTEC